MISRIVFLVGLLTLCSCEKAALLTTPHKTPVISHSRLADEAESNFWETLHQGNYAGLPHTIKLLTAAYLQNPEDPRLAAHLGFAHIWKLTERRREQNIPPTITDEIVLAKKFFQDAVELQPQDARFQGFLGDSMLASGKIYADEREQVRGYFQLKRAIAMWPEFNYFTAGYVMSDLSPDSPHFTEGLDWQWKTLDLCSGTHISRTHPDFSPDMRNATQTGRKRACWNSWIAPHNFEGFFLNMGDMLVKKGDWRTAVRIYQQAKLSRDYDNWPYRDMLEKRITNVRENVAYFQNNNGTNADTRILFSSGFGCAACHQK